MDFLSWLQVLTICMVGVMSTGLSLTLVVSDLSVTLFSTPKVGLYVSHTGVALLISLTFPLGSLLDAAPELEISNHGSNSFNFKKKCN